MPSSTFSSDPTGRAPSVNWGTIWGAAIVLATVAIVQMEMYWRSNGHRPSIVDDPLLWSLHRHLVRDREPQLVALGASRIQLGFSTGEFRRRFPRYPLTVLAVEARGPVAALRDLARDQHFRGIVVCSVTAQTVSSLDWEAQQEYVDCFHRMPRTQLLEPLLKSWLQHRLVVSNANVNLVRVIEWLAEHNQLPAPLYIVTRFDRSRLADFTMLNVARLRQGRLEKVRQFADCRIPHGKWIEDAKALKAFVTGIRDRGGRVVFVRCPTTGEHWEIDEKRHPRHLYWDQLQSATGAETIHWRDLPGLDRIDCPDTSHLDQRDAPIFTNALLDELVRRRILPDG